MSDAGAGELAASAIVMIAAAVPVARVVFGHPVRREFRAHPVLGTLAAIGVIAVLAVGLWLFMQSPGTRRAIIIVAAAGTVVAWIHARPSYGTRRGLPPGSLGLSSSLEAVDDPVFYARMVARHGPVFKMRQVHRPVACVSDLAIGRDVLERNGVAFEASDWAFNRLVPGGYLEYMEGGAHDRYRHAFAPAFTTDDVRAAHGVIARTSRQQLSAMALSAGMTGVHPEPFLLEVPFLALLHTMLGVDPAHPRLAELRTGFEAITVPFEVHLPTPPSIARGYADLVAITHGLAEVAADSPIPSVLRSLVRQDAAHARDATIVGNLVLMVKEGSIMVRGLLRWVLKALAADPSHARSLRAAAGDPARVEALSVAFVRETLRLHESRYLYRTAREDVMIGRFRVPKGWLIRLCIGEAHENPRHFPDPQRFDPSRFMGFLPGPDQYCPFGAGAHACLGEDITLAIAGGFAREAALGFDLHTVSDGPMWRINRHWGLWRPSPEFRMTLTPLAAVSHA